MFKKLHRQLDRKREGRYPIKFRFDVRVLEVTGLPRQVQQCRVVWSRGAKVQMTSLAETKADGSVYYGKDLSQMATIYKDSHGNSEPKEYAFKLQAPAGGGDDRMVTVGKGSTNMARYAQLDIGTSALSVLLKFVVGGKSAGTGELRLEVAAEMLKGTPGEDGITVVSELTGISSTFDNPDEQDLEGFGNLGPESRQVSLATVSLDRNASLDRSRSLSRELALERGSTLSGNVSMGRLPPLGRNVSLARNASLSRNASIGRSGSLLRNPSLDRRASLEPGDAAASKGKKGPSEEPGPREAYVEELQARLAELQSQVGQGQEERSALDSRLKEAVAAAKADAADLRQQLEAALQEKGSMERQVRDVAAEKAALEKQLKDAAAKAKAEAAALSRQVDTERAEKAELEKRLEHQLHALGEEAIQEAVASAVASREIRYQNLREDYEEMAVRAQEDIDELNEQLLGCQLQIMELGKRLDCSDEARESLSREKKNLEASLVETSGDQMEMQRQCRQLESENEDLRQRQADHEEESLRQLQLAHENELLLQQQLAEESEALRQMQLASQTALAEEENGAVEEGDAFAAALDEVQAAQMAQTGDCDGLLEEAQEIMLELVDTKLQFAQLSEHHIIVRRDLYKAREANLRLASKMTKLETIVYKQRARNNSRKK